MSAYGALKRVHNTEPLTQPATIWISSWSKNSSKGEFCSLYHLTLQSARALPGLLEYLRATFAKEVENGMTYPQEGEISQVAFEGYFFADDSVFIGVIPADTTPNSSLADSEEITVVDQDQQVHSIETERGERDWSDCIGGFYYIKPNYPGRSSHICNAGFVVPPKHRGRGFGISLAKSYLYYAPRLGYRASIFNLVYVNNIASVKLWDRLGFTKVGRIPQAGRLRTKDGQGEEYVDAWVIYKSFINPEGEVLGDGSTF